MSRTFWIFPLCLVMIMFYTMGCALIPSHIHNPQAYSTSQKAQKTFEDYSKNVPSMYEDMLVNIEKFKVEEEYLLSEFANNHEKALVTELASISGEKLTGRIGTVTVNLKELKTTLNNKVNEYLIKTKIQTEILEGAQESISKLATQIDVAKDELTAWNQSVAVIQASMKDLPDTIEKFVEDDPRKVAKEIGEKEITYKDAEGKEVKKKISDVFSKTSFKFDEDKNLFNIPDAPGITLQVINLGLDLAELEKRRAENNLDQLGKRKEIYEDVLLNTKVAEKLLEGATEKNKNYVDDPKQFTEIVIKHNRDISGTNTPTETVIHDTNEIARRLEAFREVAHAESIITRNMAVFPVTLARMDHEDSIIESKINDEAWRTLIQSGLNTLVAYHQTGFTPEDAAKIVQTAEAIALVFIASDVD